MRAVRNNITHEQVHALLSCDPESGVLIWRVNRGRNAKVGDVAGSVRPDGYIRIKVCRINIYAHRVVWMYFTGAWPMEEIDHLDGNRSNNRFDNLREGTKQKNIQNQRRPQRNNKCGLMGVHWHKHVKKWVSQISLDNRVKHIGYFLTKEEAHAAYLDAKRKLHEFCVI